MNARYNSFLGKQEIKDKYIARMKEHMRLDQLVQGTGFSKGKGCAVGCTLDEYSHIKYEDEICPFELAILEDQIFESLSVEESRSFPLEFLEAIPVGVDLTNVYNKMEVWLLTDPTYGLVSRITEESDKKIAMDLSFLHDKKIAMDLSFLHERKIKGEDVLEEEWKSIADRADRAYRAYLADRADRAYLADRAYRAYLAYLADRAYRADRAYLAYRADRAYLAYLAYLAYRAVAMRKKIIELIKECK